MFRAMAIVLCASAPLAFAGGTATLQANEDEPATRLTWNDDDAVRLEPEGGAGYMLLVDGKAYSVSDAGGRLMVMDLSSMSRMISGSSTDRMGAPAAADASRVSSMEATGESETIAGIEGAVYRVAWTDDDDQRRTDEAVLSRQASALAMSAALRRVTQAMTRATGGADLDALGQALNERELGILRFGHTFRVTSLSSQTPPANSFELPAEPMNMRQLMQGMQN